MFEKCKTENYQQQTQKEVKISDDIAFGSILSDGTTAYCYIAASDDEK